MRRKMFLAGLGVAMAFLTLAVFAAFGEPGDGANGSVETAEQAVLITNIPANARNGAPAYKIYIQLSTGASAKAGYVAKGEALIHGETSVTIDLKNPDGQPWIDTGRFNFAIVISPREVRSSQDVDVHGGKERFSPTIKHIAWAPGLINLHNIVPAQVEEIFEGIIKPDADILKQ
jgi:hypothetical protein